MASPTSDQELGRALVYTSLLGRMVPRRHPDDLCVCGHPRKAHEHLRRGTDCALCPAGGCSRFRRA
ncbi:hypothetical protein F0U47_15870 [Nocardioides antri]|uniref:Uncharacterized protein n=1 Tax=Nocardioides antri TaxID=2607659 RepID=A0A5B1LZG0_9ACTN|nr:hypothetical protein F0U47_15870 [Nocardioides antri]